MRVETIRLGSEHTLDLPKTKLGESPICTPDGNILYYVDVPKGRIHRHNLETGGYATIDTGTNVSFVAPEAGHAKIVVAGVGQGDIRRYNFETMGFEVIAFAQDPHPDEKSNDGKIDPSGVLVAGTKGNDEGPKIGRLSWLRAAGLTRHLDQVHISQGPTWSPDGRHMYHNDSGRHLWITPYNVAASMPDFSKRAIFAAMPNDGSVPDGLTTYCGEDGDTYVVLAKWSHEGDMGRVDVYKDIGGIGELVRRIEIPTVLQASSVIFGGPDHRDLFITTAHYGKSVEMADTYKDAGKVFVVREFAPGHPATPFDGRNFPALQVG